MARHEVVIHENTGALKTDAPYLGSYIAKETIRIEGFIAAVASLCGLPAIQVQAILTGSFDVIEELERESLVRVHTDIGTVCGVITGSFPTADAAFDPERNRLNLVLRLDDEIRTTLANVVPTIATDEDLTKLRIDNVMDLAVPRPYNLIHGQHVFRVAGFNMVLTDEGAAAYLQNALGTTFDLVVDEVVTKQLFKAHCADVIEPGDYKLVVKSKAGDAGGPLQTAFRRVKLMKVVDPPTIDQIKGDDEVTPPGKIALGRPFTITGTGLADATVNWKCVFEGEEHSGAVGVLSSTAMEIKCDSLDPIEESPFTGEIVFTVTTPNGSVTRSAEMEI